MLKCKCRMIKRYTYVRLSSMNKLFLYGRSLSKSVLSSQQTPHSLVGSKQVTHPQLKSSQSERFSQNIQVQDANNQYSCVSDPTQRLVCHNRPKGHIFSYRKSATAQDVPETVFRR